MTEKDSDGRANGRDTASERDTVTNRPEGSVADTGADETTGSPEVINIESLADIVDDVIDEDTRGPAEVHTQPAFEFDATTQQTMYVRPSSWQAIEDVEALVDARLRADYDVRNLTGSEFYDAVLRVAANHEDELIAAILAARAGEE
jgi:hypothetical protein